MDSGIQLPSPHDFLTIAHRGASSYAPENTVAAFDLALQMGASHLELDVHLTRDDHLVVIHDDTVDRTTNGTGPVASQTLAALQALERKDFAAAREYLTRCLEVRPGSGEAHFLAARTARRALDYEEAERQIREYQKLGGARYYVTTFLFLMMMALPIKMLLRWIFNLKYIVGIPEIFFNI